MSLRNQTLGAKTIVIGILTFFLLAVSPGGGSASIFEADDVVVSFHPDGKNQSELVLRMGKVRRSFERRGFFRIGALPMLAIQDVSIEFQKTQDQRAALDLVSRHISRYAGKDQLKVNLEAVALRFPGEPEPRLRANSVRLGSSGYWELSDNVQLVFEGKSVRARKAQLQVAGEKPGRLILHQRGQIISTDLFEPVLPRNPEHANPDIP